MHVIRDLEQMKKTGNIIMDEVEGMSDVVSHHNDVSSASRSTPAESAGCCGTQMKKKKKWNAEAGC
jgi:hypothetical protein